MSVDRHVMCQICGKTFLSLVGHLRRHNISSAEYRTLFPGEKTVYVSNETRKRQSSSHWSRKPLDETTHIRQQCAVNGRAIFDRINRDGRAFRMPIGYHTEDHKLRISELMSGRNVTWKDKIRSSHWITKRPEEITAIVDKIHGNASFACKHGTFFSRKMNQTFRFMSSFEERRMQFLDSCPDVLGFTNQHHIWISYVVNGKQRKYNPDFLVEMINGTFRIEEVKGAIIDVDVVFAKEQACLAFCAERNWTYKMIFRNDLESL